MFNLVTCTGDRPFCIAMTRKRLERQMSGWNDIQWIVIDDGIESSENLLTGTSLPLIYVRRIRKATDPAHTLPVNLIEADKIIGMSQNDGVLIAEDDDYYLDGWFENCRALLEEGGYDLVGEGNALYYCITIAGYRHMRNSIHASLAATCMSHKGWDRMLRKCMSKIYDPCVDMPLWRDAANIDLRKSLAVPKDSDRRMILQMKDMPGRKSTLVTHRRYATYIRDIDWRVLASHVAPEDLESYKALVPKNNGIV